MWSSLCMVSDGREESIREWSTSQSTSDREGFPPEIVVSEIEMRAVGTHSVHIEK